MSIPQLADDLVSIVIRGDYRPIQISPEWLHERELIGESEVETTKYEVLIPREITTFQSGWLRCHARPDVVELSTQQEEETERLRDVAVGVLKELHDTKISMLGINRNVHILVSDNKAWHAIGDNLVNNSAWDGLLNASGMRAAIFWCSRPDNFSGRVQIQVEPSERFKPGVFIAYNDHYDLTKLAAPITTRNGYDETPKGDTMELATEKIEVAIEALTTNWQSSMNLSGKIFERVWDLRNQQQ